MPVFAIAALVGLVCAIASGAIASHKGLNPGGYFVAGLLLGIFGLLIAVAARPRIVPGWYPDPSGQAALRWWDGKTWADQTSASLDPGVHPVDHADYSHSHGG